MDGVIGACGADEGQLELGIDGGERYRYSQPYVREMKTMIKKKLSYFYIKFYFVSSLKSFPTKLLSSSYVYASVLTVLTIFEMSTAIYYGSSLYFFEPTLFIPLF